METIRFKVPAFLSYEEFQERCRAAAREHAAKLNWRGVEWKLYYKEGCEAAIDVWEPRNGQLARD